MSSRLFFVLCLSLSIPISAFAQLTIKGTVTDERGEGLPNANIIVVGTTTGTNTDGQGNFALYLSEPEAETTIEARYVGYKSARQTIRQNSGLAEVSFQLAVDVLQFDEIVVTGLSVAASKKQLGNAISTLTVRQLESTGATSLDKALTGKLAGALIQQNSGNPGGGVTIRLRGTGTVLGDADPLYVVDGVIVNNDSPELIRLGGGSQNRLIDLNPNDVERIEIVKGAAAAALYGSRANNGVVQIFTKRGTQGKPRINYTYGLSTSKIRKTLPVNRATVDNRGNKNSDGSDVQRFDHQDFIFRRAAGMEHYASISGGSGNTRYFASGSYLADQGVIENTLFRRISARTRIDQNLSNWLALSVGGNFVFSKSNDIPNGGLNSNYGAMTGFIFGPNTYNLTPDPETGTYPDDGILANPLEVIDQYDFTQEITRYIGSAQLNATPLSGLSIDYTLGIDTYDQTAIAFIPTGTSAPGLANGFSRRAVFDFLQLNNDINLRYQRDIFPNVQSTTRIGGTLQYEKGENFSAEGRNLSPVAEVVSSGANVVAGETRSKRVIYGGFIQQTFGIANRLFVTAAARIDASSVYDADNRWQFYPKASASYLISDTGFWQNSALQNIFSDFKLRASIGTSGGQTAIGPYDRLTNYNASSYDGNPGLVPSTQLGGTIKPERQREIEIGTDFSLLSNRLGIELTYYDQRIEDLLLFRTLSPSTGHSRALQNVGTMDNTGLELLVRAIPLARPNLRWESTFTYSTNKNKVDGIEGGRLIIPNSFSQVSAIYGEPLGVFFSTAFERDTQDIIANVENNLPIQAADRKIIGDPNPDFTASWINQVALGQNWSFRMQWDAIIGGDLFNFTRRLAALSAFGVLTDYERELNGELPSGYNSRVFRIFEQWIEDGSFVKLRELSASYRWQPQFLGLSSIQLSLIGRNLLSIDDYSGYDPETNIAGQRTAVRGFDFVEVPIPRSIAFRISLNY